MVVEKREHQRVMFYCLYFWGCFFATHVYGHGEPIDILVNSATNRLFALPDITPGSFEANGGYILSTLPGLGVRFDSNGIAKGAQLSMDITQQLLYWDGTQATESSNAVQVISPNLEQSFIVDSQSSAQSGMALGTYDGQFAWEADPTYRIDSPNPAPGIYGLAARVNSPAYEPTAPFLIPLVYNPQNTWDGAQITAGIDLLREEVVVNGSADFDADGDVDGSDFLAWQRGFGTISLTTLHADGDADLDSDVDIKDLVFWQQQFGQVITAMPSQPVPEPTTIWLLTTTALLLFSKSRKCLWTLRVDYDEKLPLYDDCNIGVSYQPIVCRRNDSFSSRADK